MSPAQSAPTQVIRKDRTMPQPSHTPYVFGEATKVALHLEGPDGRDVASMHRAGLISDDQWQRIVNLVAAAPQLLTALEIVAASGPLNNGMRDDAALNLVRMAISIAKGEA